MHFNLKEGGFTLIEHKSDDWLEQASQRCGR